MALPDATKIPTIIVNAYDLMWYDIDIPGDDPNSFFFKNDPVTYLQSLKNEGWTIYLYASSMDDELNRLTFYQMNPPGYLSQKLYQIALKFEGPQIANFVNEVKLLDIIENAESSSFAIIDPTRKFRPGIARYSPIEIFELVDPPVIPPNFMISVVYTNSVSRGASLMNKMKIIIRKDVYEINGEKDNYDRLRGLVEPLFLVWSPVYRYSDNDIVLNNFYNVERPDQQNIPGVTVYTWGF
ncbi:Hypothetical protein HVR_LOCUS353 [uncultured virus]|nr:Hypothetical protein HVR_LOCUS353 [uncultured virus]